MADKNQATKLILAIAILAIAAALVVMRDNKGGNSGAGPTSQAWYYDVDTGQLFAGASAMIPPVDAPSGPGNGVRAHIYTCGACEPGEWQIVYLQSMTERAKALLADPDLPRQPGGELTGERIAEPPADGEAIDWISAANPRAMQIQQRATTLCGDAPATPCMP